MRDGGAKRKIIVFCNHRKEFHEELQSLKDRIITAFKDNRNEDNYFDYFEVTRYLPTRSTPWFSTYEDIPLILLNILAMDHLLAIFLLSPCHSSMCRCLLTETPENLPKISKAFCKTSLSGNYGWLSGSSFAGLSITELIASVAGGLTTQKMNTENSYFFFKSPVTSTSRKCQWMESLRYNLINKGLHVHHYEEYDETSDAFFEQLKRICEYEIENTLQSASCDATDEIVEFRTTACSTEENLQNLTNIFNHFCDPLINDARSFPEEERIFEGIMKHYTREDWSSKMHRVITKYHSSNAKLSS
ncbi:hypothetical protein EG68_10310 [Paragonimus skrjabini miyazakii]|uniref:Uncharacterized protein n=1 Tax=Paragonimus skrjabini miyazakii TaxID=59628 RepID=A0A8S9Y887_9TREM|nr:hypothetical protein EG68_10310 [Paragonimus skrjabini miyazakii]